MPSWADHVRYLPQYGWMAPLHYVEGKDDYLSERCEWSWQELAAMWNMTDTLQYWDGEEEEIGSRTSGSTKVFRAFSW